MRERAAVSNPSKSVRENLYRPCGTRPDLKLYPGLPSGADIFRPSGLGSSRSCSARFMPSLVRSHAHSSGLSSVREFGTELKLAYGYRAGERDPEGPLYQRTLLLCSLSA